MSHQVHPKVFRLREAGDWDSRWIAKKNRPELLEQDFRIREYLQKRLKDMSVEGIEIERFVGKTNIIINSSRPGLIIGRGGSGVEEIRNDIVKLIEKLTKKKQAKGEIRLEIKEIKNPWTSAVLSGQWIAQQLEQRKPYRRILKQALQKIMANKEIKGARIDVAGRLGGADIARRETLREGRLPLQTIRSNIDYGLVEARTTYGAIGVKVWLYKGDRFEK